MPKAQPLPRKNKSRINDAQDNLRYIAHQAELAREALHSERRSISYVQNLLQGIEALSYKTALELGEVDIATDCDSCPLAPPTSQYQSLLIFLAMHLDQLANVARRGGKAAAYSNIPFEFDDENLDHCED